VCACRHCGQSSDTRPLKESLRRLSLLIQNMHNLMIYTKAHSFEHCTHHLFRRYIIACRLTGEAERARTAWTALLRTGNAVLLQDVDMSMVYVDTLLARSREDDTEGSQEYLEDAMRCRPGTTFAVSLQGPLQPLLGLRVVRLGADGHLVCAQGYCAGAVGARTGWVHGRSVLGAPHLVGVGA
jgi:hypothetical protein